MSRFLFHSLLIVEIIAGLSACKKDADNLGKMIAISSESIGIKPYTEFTVCADGRGGIYVFQETETEYVARVGFSTDRTTWNFHEIEFESLGYRVREPLKMQATADGSVWLLGYRKLYQFLGGELVLEVDLATAAGVSGEFTRITVNDENVWLLHSVKGLYGMNRSLGVVGHLPDPTIPNYAYDNVIADADNNVWISKKYYAENLIGLMSDGTWKYPNDPDSVLACPTCNEWTNGYKTLFLATADRLGITYLGMGSEFLRIKDKTLEIIAPPNGAGYVATMFTDRHDRFWMHSIYTSYSNSTISSFVHKYEGSQNTSYFDVTDVFEGNVWLYDSSVDRNNNILVATNKGIAVYNYNGVCF